MLNDLEYVENLYVPSDGFEKTFCFLFMPVQLFFVFNYTLCYISILEHMPVKIKLYCALTTFQ